MTPFEKLLNIAVENKCAAVRCAVGEPFSVQLDDRWVRLEMPVVTVEDSIKVMDQITPEQERQELFETDRTDFDFSTSDGVLFHVTLLKLGDSIQIEGKRV